MLSPLTNEEAVLSSGIEGTQATIDEVLEHEAGIIRTGAKGEDIREILNYRKALSSAQMFLKDRPISMHLIRELHKILLDGVRGQNKTPGEIRTEQNWIGRSGCSLEDASFVPPNPMQLSGHLENWEKYTAGTDIDVLIQAGIVHAQFELLHPFKDGNGRLGRMLIPLFLFQKGALSLPMFYLSAYLEARRDKYYLSLQNISSSGDWDGWLEFFLKAVAVQAEENSFRVGKILSLYDRMKNDIQESTHSRYTIQILDFLFSRPVFKSTDFVNSIGVTKPTAISLIRRLEEDGILKEIETGRGRRASIHCFPELLNIAEGKKLF